MEEMRIAVDFQGEPQDAQSPEDLTAAYLWIYMGDDCLTRNRPRRPHLAQASDSVFGPIAGVVDWLIDNWGPIHWEMHGSPISSNFTDDPLGLYSSEPERLGDYWDESEDDGPVLSRRPGPEADQGEEELETGLHADWLHRHTLGHASSDLALPFMLIIPEDRNVGLFVNSPLARLNPDVEFLGIDGKPRTRGLSVCRKTSFHAAATELINKTLERAASKEEFAYWAIWLRERWEQAQADEENPVQRLKWMIGDVAAGRVEELRVTNHRLADALQHLLFDCRTATKQSELVPAERIVEEFAFKKDFSSGEIPSWRGLEQDSISTDRPVYAQGYQLARLVRRKMNLGDGPIVSHARILKRLDVTEEDACNTALFRAAVCAPSKGLAHIIPSSADARLESPSAYRFAMIVALGRLLWQSRISTGPVCLAHGDHAMLIESRRARAFAAEFLLPREAIEGMSPGSEELSKVAVRYGVSRTLAEWHSRNLGSRWS
jgi:hypothetical protein